MLYIEDKYILFRCCVLIAWLFLKTCDAMLKISTFFNQGEMVFNLAPHNQRSWVAHIWSVPCLWAPSSSRWRSKKEKVDESRKSLTQVAANPCFGQKAVDRPREADHVLSHWLIGSIPFSIQQVHAEETTLLLWRWLSPTEFLCNAPDLLFNYLT